MANRQQSSPNCQDSDQQLSNKVESKIIVHLINVDIDSLRCGSPFILKKSGKVGSEKSKTTSGGYWLSAGWIFWLSAVTEDLEIAGYDWDIVDIYERYTRMRSTLAPDTAQKIPPGGKTEKAKSEHCLGQDYHWLVQKYVQYSHYTGYSVPYSLLDPSHSDRSRCPRCSHCCLRMRR